MKAEQPRSRDASTAEHKSAVLVPDKSTAVVSDGIVYRDDIGRATKPPDKPPEPPRKASAAPDMGVIRGLVSPAFARSLEDTSGRARAESRRTWAAFFVLAVVAAAAFAAALIAKNESIWAAASTILVATGLVASARAADSLGASATAIAFLRTQSKVEAGVGADEKSPKPKPTTEQRETAAILLAQALEREGKRDQAKCAYSLAAQEGGNPEGPRRLAMIYLEESDFDKAIPWLKEAMERGSTSAAYEFGRLNPNYDVQPPFEYLQFIKRVAQAHPDRAIYWQAYHAAVCARSGLKSANQAIIETYFEQPYDPTLHLLAIRASAPNYADVLADIEENTYADRILDYYTSIAATQADALVLRYEVLERAKEFPFLDHLLGDEKMSSSFRSQFPEALHSELYFHAAVKLMYGDHESPTFQAELNQAIDKSLALAPPTGAPWLRQIPVMQIAATIIDTVNNDKLQQAGTSLADVLATNPPINAPLSLDDARALAVVLANAGKKDAAELVSEIVCSRPNIKDANSTYRFERAEVAVSLIRSMVQGVELGAPVPSTGVQGAKDLSLLIRTKNSTGSPPEPPGAE
jgi:TPR repeat protein